jgi:uncharacterized membrane protein YkoI
MSRIRIIALACVLLLPAVAHAQSGTISIARARSIALGSVPGNQGVKSEKLKTEDGVEIYEFDIRTAGPGHREVRVDARTGAIVQNKHEEGALSTAAHETEKAAKKVGHDVDKAADHVFRKDEIATMRLRISEARARRIALRANGGGRVKDIDLEREHGVVVWDVKLEGPGKGDRTVRVDANTGAVIKIKD